MQVGTTLVMCVIVERAAGTILDDTNKAGENQEININHTMTEKQLNKTFSAVKIEDYLPNLTTPLPYTVEDLLMSLGLLLLLFILFCLWYSLARLCIHLVYHKTHQRIKKMEEAELEEELSTKCSKDDREDHPPPHKIFRSNLIGSDDSCQLLETEPDQQERMGTNHDCMLL